MASSELSTVYWPGWSGQADAQLARPGADGGQPLGAGARLVAELRQVGVRGVGRQRRGHAVEAHVDRRRGSRGSPRGGRARPSRLRAGLPAAGVVGGEGRVRPAPEHLDGEAETHPRPARAQPAGCAFPRQVVGAVRDHGPDGVDARHRSRERGQGGRGARRRARRRGARAAARRADGRRRRALPARAGRARAWSSARACVRFAGLVDETAAAPACPAGARSATWRASASSAAVSARSRAVGARRLGATPGLRRRAGAAVRRARGRARRAGPPGRRRCARGRAPTRAGRAYAEDLARLLRRLPRRARAARAAATPSCTRSRRSTRCGSTPRAWGGTPVFFYGFDDLTPLQRDAVETLGARRRDVTVSLSYEAGRHAFAGRASTFEELRPLADEVVALPARDEHYAPAARDALHALERGLFEDGGAGALDPGDAVALLEAGGERAELELVAAEVAAAARRRRARGGDRRGRALARGGRAAARARCSRRFAVPFSLRRRVPFGHTAVGRGLLALLRCATGGDGRGRRSPGCARPGSSGSPRSSTALERHVRRSGPATAAEALAGLRDGGAPACPRRSTASRAAAARGTCRARRPARGRAQPAARARRARAADAGRRRRAGRRRGAARAGRAGGAGRGRGAPRPGPRRARRGARRRRGRSSATRPARARGGHRPAGDPRPARARAGPVRAPGGRVPAGRARPSRSSATTSAATGAGERHRAAARGRRRPGRRALPVLRDGLAARGAARALVPHGERRRRPAVPSFFLDDVRDLFGEALWRDRVRRAAGRGRLAGRRADARRRGPRGRRRGPAGAARGRSRRSPRARAAGAARAAGVVGVEPRGVGGAARSSGSSSATSAPRTSIPTPSP